jgi:hypothetical protein
MAKEAKAVKNAETKPTAASSESSSPSATEAPSSSETTSSSSKKSGNSSRPISYFSSVSTDEYRSGWEEIFGGQKTKKPKIVKARTSKLPTTLTINFDDLDAETQKALELLAQKSAKKQRLNYDALKTKKRVAWSLSCRILD